MVQAKHEAVARDIAIAGFANLLPLAQAFVVLPVITKSLGESAYGIFVQFTVTVGLAMTLAVLGLHSGMIRFLAAEKDRRAVREGFYSTAFSVLGTSLVAGLILMVFSRALAASLFEGQVRIVVMCALVVPISSVNLVFLMFFRTLGRVKRYATILFVQTSAEIVAIWSAVLLGRGVFGATMAMFIVRTAVSLFMLGLIMREIGFGWPSFAPFGKYLRYGLPFVPGNILSWALNSSDKYLISVFLGVSFVGIYSPGHSMGNLIKLFPGPLEFVLLPTLAKLYDEGKLADVKLYLHFALKYVLLLAIPAVFGLSLLSKPLLVIMSTAEIASRGWFVTPFVAVAALLYGIAVVHNLAIALVKKTVAAGIAWTVAGVSNIALNLVFIPWLGILGAAITALIGFALATAIFIWHSSRCLRFGFPWAAVVKSVLASLAMSAFIWAMRPGRLADTLFCIACGTAIYGLALAGLGGIRRNELRLFRSLLKPGRRPK